jgi:hypothetical protein
MKKSIIYSLAIIVALGCGACSQQERVKPISRTVPSGAREPFSEQAFRENLPKARRGDPQAMVVLVNYYSDRDMRKQSQYWRDRIDAFYAKRDGRDQNFFLRNW